MREKTAFVLYFCIRTLSSPLLASLLKKPLPRLHSLPTMMQKTEMGWASSIFNLVKVDREPWRVWEGWDSGEAALEAAVIPWQLCRHFVSLHLCSTWCLALCPFVQRETHFLWCFVSSGSSFMHLGTDSCRKTLMKCFQLGGTSKSQELVKREQRTHATCGSSEFEITMRVSGCAPELSLQAGWALSGTLVSWKEQQNFGFTS